jgi:hypothetical protein
LEDQDCFDVVMPSAEYQGEQTFGVFTRLQIQKALKPKVAVDFLQGTRPDIDMSM